MMQDSRDECLKEFWALEKQATDLLIGIKAL